MMLDGTPEFYQLVQYALAAMIADPSVIIYFLIKRPGYTGYRDHMTYDAILVRPELRFRRSEWYDLKGHLNPQHYAGKYTIHYDGKKLDDWWNRLERKKPWFRYNYFNRVVYDLLGETVFFVTPRHVCYLYHSDITKGLESFDPGDECGSFVSIGYILTEKAIQRGEEFQAAWR